jgi:hypothetical protein
MRKINKKIAKYSMYFILSGETALKPIMSRRTAIIVRVA